MGAGLVWTAVAFGTSYREYSSLRDALRSGNFEVVQGPVENFVEGDGRRPESFDVRGHRYSYSWSVIQAGFNSPGLIRPGLEVRIADVNGEIARLEVSR